MRASGPGGRGGSPAALLERHPGCTPGFQSHPGRHTWEKVGRAAGEVAQQRSMRDTQAAGASVSLAGRRFPEATPEKMAGSVSPGYGVAPRVQISHITWIPLKGFAWEHDVIGGAAQGNCSPASLIPPSGLQSPSQSLRKGPECASRLGSGCARSWCLQANCRWAKETQSQEDTTQAHSTCSLGTRLAVTAHCCEMELDQKAA